MHDRTGLDFGCGSACSKTVITVDVVSGVRGGGVSPPVGEYGLETNSLSARRAYDEYYSTTASERGFDTYPAVRKSHHTAP
ncbi:MAG: hypothetical protein OXI96_03990 [Acidimicrobiaceae bacterium]|nr:hypothetical protein [Acidimicrobiaceae bacterium]